MNCVAIIFVAFLAINSGPSLAFSGKNNSLSRKTVGDYRNNIDGEAYDSFKQYTKQFDATVKGRNVELSNGFQTAARIRPTESNLYASVVSNSILEDDQVFQIRVDERIENLSDYGIGIGVIERKQEDINNASAITWSSGIKGTWAIYSSSASQSGKSNTFKDGYVITDSGYPLSTNHLSIGTLIGVSRRRNGNLHYYLNGVDKGAAFISVPNDVYAFVDIINHVTKISIAI